MFCVNAQTEGKNSDNSDPFLNFPRLCHNNKQDEGCRTQLMLNLISEDATWAVLFFLCVAADRFTAHTETAAVGYMYDTQCNSQPSHPRLIKLRESALSLAFRWHCAWRRSKNSSNLALKLWLLFNKTSELQIPPTQTCATHETRWT